MSGPVDGTTEQKSAVVHRTVTRDLPVTLTEHELAGIAKQIGQKNRERSVMEGQAKVSSQQWKDRISGIDAQIADLATKADDGKEARPVECNEIHDYRLGEVRFERADNGERLDSRPMQNHERQPSLPLQGAENVTPIKGKRGGKNGATPPAPDAVATSAGADPDAPPPDDTDITEPQATLDGAVVEPEDDGGTTPRKKKRD